MLSHAKTERRSPRRPAGARRAALVILALLGALGLTSLAGAQERQLEIAVLQTATEPKEGAPTLPLSVFFALRDQNGNPIPKSEVSFGAASVTVTTPDNQALPPVEATVSDPETPIRIALVIDRSGSMNQKVGTAAGEQRTLDQIVRDAAVESINSAPPQAEFAVFSFAEKTELRSGGFLRRADQAQLIEDAIRGYNTNAPGTGNTCITDAALEAISYLNANPSGQAVERKALILFTDGLDKEANGRPTNGNDCSNLGFDAIIRSAQLSSGTIIPIYTIWPCEQCDDQQRANLENLARETRGVAAVGSLQEVGTLFQRVMELLNSQWVLRANVLAGKGTNTATIRVQLGDGGTFLTAAPPFESPFSYTARGELSVAQVQYLKDQDSYKVTLTVNNAENVGQVTAGVYNLDTGGVLVSQEQRFENPGAQLTFDLPSAGLRAGESYFLRISGQDKAGQPLADGEGRPLLISYPFRYEPELGYTIGAVTPEWEADRLVVAVAVRGAGQRELSFSGEITNRESGAKEALELAPLRDGQLRFPMPKMLDAATQPGSYEIALQLEDGENVIRQTTDPPVTITPLPPEAPNLLPFVLGGLGVVLIGVIGGLLYVRSRPKKQSIPLPYNTATMLGPKATPGTEAAKPPPAPVSPPTPGPSRVVPSPAVKMASPAASSSAGAALTEVQSARPAAEPTVLHGGSQPTMLHEEHRPRLRVKVLRTVDPREVREQTVDLPCTIGREQAQFVITGDPKTSRQHAQIRLEGERLLLVDLNSTNGTFVQETQLAKQGSASLESPTVIGIGPNTRLEIELV